MMWDGDDVLIPLEVLRVDDLHVRSRDVNTVVTDRHVPVSFDEVMMWYSNMCSY